jgi:hypothetical protein
LSLQAQILVMGNRQQGFLGASCIQEGDMLSSQAQVGLVQGGKQAGIAGVQVKRSFDLLNGFLVPAGRHQQASLGIFPFRVGLAQLLLNLQVDGIQLLQGLQLQHRLLELPVQEQLIHQQQLFTGDSR